VLVVSDEVSFYKIVMLGLGRLFSDDTSIGHTAHDENTLKNMINIDLKYIQKWAKR
jgi:hypothetical protein